MSYGLVRKRPTRRKGLSKGYRFVRKRFTRGSVRRMRRSFRRKFKRYK